MTTGALIFAFDNESTDYVTMAGWSARNIRRWLNIPTAVVTDAPPKIRDFEALIKSSVPSLNREEHVGLRIIKQLLRGTTQVELTPTLSALGIKP